MNQGLFLYEPYTKLLLMHSDMYITVMILMLIVLGARPISVCVPQ